MAILDEFIKRPFYGQTIQEPFYYGCRTISDVITKGGIKYHFTCGIDTYQYRRMSILITRSKLIKGQWVKISEKWVNNIHFPNQSAILAFPEWVKNYISKKKIKLTNKPTYWYKYGDVF